MTFQVRIGKRRKRNVGQYRAMHADGRWSPHWHHLTVAEAKKALRDGHLEGYPDHIVVPYYKESQS